MIEQRGKSYGLILRKLDYPTTSNNKPLRRLSMASSQRGGSGRVGSPPLLVYRVYPDGREELVRGMRFRSLNVRALRDIIAASDSEHLVDFIGSVASIPGAGSGFVTTHTVVAPSVLFEDMGMDKREEDWPKPPIVPPPVLVSSR